MTTSTRGREPLDRDRGDECLRKSDRLRKRREYLIVQRRGTKVPLRDMLVMVRRGSGRVGVTVTKKVGGAVKRNRIKRLVREVWRRERMRLPAGLDLVFVAKKSAVEMTYNRLRQQFDYLERKLSRSHEGSGPRR